MKEIPINNWEEFEKKITTRSFTRYDSPSSTMLFRGQADSEWELETTLERSGKEKMSSVDYYKLILTTKPQVETFTNENFDLITVEDYKKLINQKNTDISRFNELLTPEYRIIKSYMTYLRHHGFPSPLLDWTKSPYIAAFFAYRTVKKKVKDVSIYALPLFSDNQNYAGVKGELRRKIAPSSDELFMIRLRLDVKTHKRHFLQQSQYTICLELEKNIYYYSCHGKILPTNEPSDDMLCKFKLPASQRIEFLKKLDSMNINAFSLFGTEESLMETIALRELEFKIN